MRVIDWNTLDEQERRAALRRPASAAAADAADAVRAILDDVRLRGDVAIRALTRRFEGFDPEPLYVPERDKDAADTLALALRRAIDTAYANIRRFHERQGLAAYEVETMPGLRCARAVMPVQKVGLYIPGGSAPLFLGRLGALWANAGNAIIVRIAIKRRMDRPLSKIGRAIGLASPAPLTQA